MNRKKRVILLICIFILITTVGFAEKGTVFSTDMYRIKLGNIYATFEDIIYNYDDMIYVPLRKFCDELKIPVVWDETNAEVYVDVYHKNVTVSDKTDYNEDGVIPDEETALIVGKAILEKYANRPMEYETDDKRFYLIVRYSEPDNSWGISQHYDYKNGVKWVGSGLYLPMVKLNKNTGEVMYINTHSSFPD